MTTIGVVPAPAGGLSIGRPMRELCWAPGVAMPQQRGRETCLRSPGSPFASANTSLLRTPPSSSDAGVIVALLGTNGAGRSSCLKARGARNSRAPADETGSMAPKFARWPSHAIVERSLVLVPEGPRHLCRARCCARSWRSVPTGVARAPLPLSRAFARWASAVLLGEQDARQHPAIADRS